MEIPARFKGIIDKIMTVAQANGVRAYPVGGFVRDLIRNVEPKDLDIAVDADGGGQLLANKVAEAYGLNPPSIYPKMGTAMIKLDGEDIEFAMLRNEIYSDASGKPVSVAYGTLQEDAARRDLTINAMYFDTETGEILDPTGKGQADLKAGILRSPNLADPKQTYIEDPSRLLRLIKFYAKTGFQIDPATYRAAVDTASHLKPPKAPNEIVGKLFSDVLQTDNAYGGVKMMDDMNLLTMVIPEFAAAKGMSQPPQHHTHDVATHVLETLRNIKGDWIDKLAAILHDISKPDTRTEEDDVIHFIGHEIEGEKKAMEIMDRLALAPEVKQQVAKMVFHHMRPHHYTPDWTDKTIRKFITDVGVDNVDRVLSLAEADVQAGNPERVSERLSLINEMRERVHTIMTAEPDTTMQLKPVLDGNDLMALFNKPGGPWIKALQNFIIDKQLENPNLTKEEATELARANFDKAVAGQLQPEASFSYRDAGIWLQVGKVKGTKWQINIPAYRII